MNRTNGDKNTASASTSHYSKEDKYKERPSSSVFPTFLKWFKRNEKPDTNFSDEITCKTPPFFNGHNTLSSSSSPYLDTLTSSSSCDSVLSTSTTGFAFINPQYYKPYSYAKEPKALIIDSHRTVSQRRKTKKYSTEGPKLSLRKKYFLYDTDTLTSNDISDPGYNNIKYYNNSFPNSKEYLIEIQNEESHCQHRRVASENSKDKKSGPYVHVKGKRKAPPPPFQITNKDLFENIGSTLITNLNEICYSSGSTLGRKKRRAPPPPLSPKPQVNAPTFYEGLLNDNEIIAIIEGIQNSKKSGEKGFPKMFTKRILAGSSEPNTSNKMGSINNDDVTSEIHLKKDEAPNKYPNFSVSPKPWYKRPISAHRDSSVPFKREVVLKTMEKRKHKVKEREPVSSILPEVGFSRSFVVDSGNRFGFFLRHKNHSDENKSKDKEKRRSGIGIPNISALDREAAEIVNKEQASAEAREKSKREKFFSPDHLLLQQKMFAVKAQNDSNSQKQVSTKQTVSHDEKIINENENTAETLKQLPIFSSEELARSTKMGESVNSPRDEQVKLCKPEQNATSTTWSCPFCTLLNPNWRIICAACGRFTSCDELKTSPLRISLSNRSSVDKHTISENDFVALGTHGPQNEHLKPLDSPVDGENKAEEILNYFMSGKSSKVLSEESAVIKKPSVIGKSLSSNKLPISSPNLSRRYGERNIEKNEMRSSLVDITSKETATKVEKEVTLLNYEKKPPLLDSSAIITTITPVFYANITTVKQPETIHNIEFGAKKNGIDLNEVRSARLAKFLPTKAEISTTGITSPTNHIKPTEYQEETLLGDKSVFLEREKERLREKIRIMNARALEGKCTMLPKSTLPQTLSPPLTTELVNKNPENNDATKHGAIKKILHKTSENRSLKKLQNEPITQRITTKFNKPKKVSTSAQTSGYVKKFDKLKSSSFGNFPENQTNHTKLNNFIHSDAKTVSLQYIWLSEREKAKVEEISQQLQSPGGISYFKATLRNSSKAMSETDTITLNKIMRNLELAIAAGQDELAARLAMDLAKMKVSLQVTKVKNRYIDGAVDNGQAFITNLYIVDEMSKKGPIHIVIEPLMTLLDLKQKTLEDFKIPPESQKWLINDKTAIETNKTLLEYGVRDCTSEFFLYLTAPEREKVEGNEADFPISETSIVAPEVLSGESNEKGSNFLNDVESSKVEGAALPVFETPKCGSSADNWQCPLCTLINFANDAACSACSKAKPQLTNAEFTHSDQFNLSDELKQFLTGAESGTQCRILEQKNDLNKINSNKKSSEIYNIFDDKIKVTTPALSDTGNVNAMKKTLSSSSPNITKNKYRGVDNYNPNRKNLDGALKINTPYSNKKAKPRAPAPPTVSRTSHYLELLQLDTTDIVFNKESFECPVCFVNFQPGEGIVLRECLHSFCKDCLNNTIRYSDEAEVKCPYMDTTYSCNSILQEREIKAIVSKEIYEQHLAKSIRVAENQIENAFHCKTPNCRGWCIYEDNVNEFKCPVCRITNCLMCRVIHDGLTCKQYQDRLDNDCDSNLDARQTREMLKEMVEKGEAMNCPTCQVIMMKKWGCDWLKCSMCKTEVCWVTRGPRWGPGGKGDTTGGCKCGLDGKKCHPKCNYCH